MCCNKEGDLEDCCSKKCCCGSSSGGGDDDGNRQGSRTAPVPGSPSPSSSCGLCQPYRDGVLVTAQFLSIVAFLLSWIFWVTFLLGMTVMILLQVVWCCTMSRAGLNAAAVLSLITALTCLLYAIFALVDWQGDTYCHVFVLTDDFIDDQYNKYNGGNSSDYCIEVAWAVIGFIVATMWGAVTGLLLHFLHSGRYGKCQAESAQRLQRRTGGHGNGSGDGDVEMAINPVEVAPVASPISTFPSAPMDMGSIASSPQAFQNGNGFTPRDTTPSDMAVTTATAFLVEEKGSINGYAAKKDFDA